MSSGPVGEPYLGSFAQAVLGSLDQFRLRGSPSNVMGRFVLANGESYYYLRPGIRFLDSSPGCVVIYGGEEPDEGAIVVREEHIFYVELDRRVETPPGSLGFA